MKSFPECMATYKQQMIKGDIQTAYDGLMQYIVGLRKHLKTNHPEFYVSGNFYQGHLDFTYFSFTPVTLKRRRLRVAIVFIHKTLEFKVWLGGLNKKVQANYWEKFTTLGWSQYTIPKSIEGVDYIVETTLAVEPDFGDLDGLTKQLEQGIMQFVDDVELRIETL